MTCTVWGWTEGASWLPSEDPLIVTGRTCHLFLAGLFHSDSSHRSGIREWSPASRVTKRLTVADDIGAALKIDLSRLPTKTFLTQTKIGVEVPALAVSLGAKQMKLFVAVVTAVFGPASKLFAFSFCCP